MTIDTTAMNSTRRIEGIFRDISAGAVVALVSAAYSLSYAALIFSGPLSGGIAAGITVSLIGAAVGAIAVAVLGSIPVAISGPDTASMAIFSGVSAAIASNAMIAGDADTAIFQVLATMTVTALLTGGALLVFGALHLGAWIRFIPYPVVGGFLAASGWLLCVGAINMMSGDRIDFMAFDQLIGADYWPRLGAGLVFAAVMFIATVRVKSALMVPGLLVLGSLVVHLVLLATGTGIDEAQAGQWLLLPLEKPDLWLPTAMFEPGAVDYALILAESAGIATVVVVTTMAILLNATGLEVSFATDANLDRELRANGVANIVATVAGGLPSSLGVNRSLLNAQAGATGRTAGVASGIFCLGFLFFGGDLVGYVPRPVLGGTLLFLGVSVLVSWLWKTRKRLAMPDYLLILAILVVIVNEGFLAGVVLGVVAACLIFAISYSRVRVIKNDLTRAEYASHVDRPQSEGHALCDHGSQIRILALQGYLFFGTSNRVFEAVRNAIEHPGKEPILVEILDFRLVSGLDSSAVYSFVKLRQLAERHGMFILLTGLSTRIREALRLEGLLQSDDDRLLEFPDLDHGLEWAENVVLAEDRTLMAEAACPFSEWLGRTLGQERLAESLMRYFERLELAPGARLCEEGAEADTIYFVESGRISILLERPDGPPIRLRSMIGHTIVGEVGFYQRAVRTASVAADEAAVVHSLSRSAFERMEADEPALAAACHAMIARVIADRLAFSNAEILALQR
ncbi:SLC26A/SulP transporter family protein [Oceanibacterium hippocampi]|uniref:Bicarbonate transporter BicA n=1 Tax=Oceanibacterium hippocampi TaxID=745714 RepID=A0A1Y5R8W5_9PROT|nr:SulP family inorganic anion transporter [Oceanibacterium hippocampi]SLN10753.1 Bicarbonate transporter BicA [Oceanibacterium hippocampi]